MSDSAIQSPPGQMAVTPEDSKAFIQSTEGASNGGQSLAVPLLDPGAQATTDTNLQPAGSPPTDAQANSDTHPAMQDQPAPDNPVTTDDNANSGDTSKGDEGKQPPPQDQQPPADGPPTEVQ